MNKLVFKDIPYILKQKKYSTIEFVLIFPCQYNKSNIFYFPLLRQLLLNTSKEFNTEEKYRKAYQENMIISETLKISNYNNNTFLTFGLLVPNPKKVKNYDLESAFKFFTDTIYKPNIINNKFDQDCFNREKEYLKENILNSTKNIHNKSYQNFINIVDDKGVLNDNIYNNMNLIEESNNEELYNVYNKYIVNNKPIIIVYGDVDESINNMIQKYIKIENKEISFVKDYDNYLIPFKEKKNIEEKSKYNQSFLYIAYKIENKKKKDDIYLKIITKILDSQPNDLVFKKLRNELGLVYSVKTWCNSKVGLLVIESYTNNNSKEEVLMGIESIFEELKDKTLLNNYIQKMIECMKYNLIRSKDSRVKKINDFISKKLKTKYTTEELIKKYENIDLDELLKFIDRLKQDTIYFLRGDFDE